jgi:hypothetical protein
VSETGIRRGPAPLVKLMERSLRKSSLLGKDEKLLEMRQGQIQRWRIDGSDQPIPTNHGLERVSMFSGLTNLSYSENRLYMYTTDNRILTTELGFILRMWVVEPRSIALIYSSFPPVDDGSLVSVRWENGESKRSEQVTALADRIRMRGRARRVGFTADWRERISGREAELTASGRLEAEIAALDGTAGAGQPRPRTVVGRWLEALILGAEEERQRLNPQLNGGAPGWNDAEPAVVEALTVLVARRYFGSQASADQLVETPAELARRFADKPEYADNVGAVIRHAAGDHTADLSHIKPVTLLSLRGIFIVFAFSKLDLAFEVDKLIGNAETLTFERGLNPPLADAAA